MRSKVLNRDGQKTYAVVFDTGDEVLSGLTEFARQNKLDAAQLTAIGAFRSATLGFFNMETKEYEEIPVNQQVEVLSLIGDITANDGEPKVHLHVVVGLRDGTTRGGHILEAHVRPTLEVIITESPQHLKRTHDEETGLSLISI